MHQVINVIPPTLYTTNTATSPNAQTVQLASNINVAGAKSGVLVAKIHSGPSAGTWSVIARNVAESSRDPAIRFVDEVNPVATIAISGGQNLWLADLDDAPIGEQLQVVLTMPALASATLGLSVDLVLRDS